MAAIYYLIDKESETGKKITEFKERIEHAKLIQKEVFAKIEEIANVEIDHYQWWGNLIIGQPIGFEFPSNPDPEVWKVVYGGMFFPKAKKGKKLIELINTIPEIERREFDRLIGNNKNFRHSGMYLYGEKYGISVDSEWEFQPNSDMVEVTYTQYENN